MFGRADETRSYELSFSEDLVYEVQQPSQFSLRTKIVNFVGKKTNKVFREKSPLVFDKSFEAITPGTTLTGYFQSPHYFEDQSDLLISRIESQFSQHELHNSIAVHLRRGDYLNVKTRNFHGLASPEYAERGIQQIRSNVGDIPIRLFSDELTEAKKEMSVFDLPNSSYVNQSGFSNLESLVQMSKSKHMVMSNSSFSWWAAYIMSKRDSSSQVIAPRPWFTDDSAASDLLLPHWLTLDMR